MKPIIPTPYPNVNELLQNLLASVTEILSDQFVGMYLFGSLANGDFDLHSDVDVLVVTKDVMSDEQFSAMQARHAELAALDHWYAHQLEVSYIPQRALWRYDPSNNRHPHLDRGAHEKLTVRQHDSDWVVQRYVLRERGIVLAGPEPKALIEEVSADDLRRAMQSILSGWYAHFPNKPDPFESRGYQSYTVLSLCRILYTLQAGNVVSKMAAAAWAKETLNARWIPLIDRAILGRQSPDAAPEPEDVRETLKMIQYTLERASPTPYPEVNEILNLLLHHVKEILGEQFVGMYLYGSLSGGDYNRETSDIDFLVVTKDRLDQNKIAELEAMHQLTWATSLKRAGELEGAYVPKDLLRRHDANGEPCPTVNERRFYIAQLGSDWVLQRYVVREWGVVVEGPKPGTLIDEIGPDNIRSAVLGILREWWFPMLADPSWLRDHERVYCSFAVITMCRALHALEHGTIVSKPRAIRWAQTNLSDGWRPLLDRAAAVRWDESKDHFVDETLAFIRFVKEQTSRFEMPIPRAGNS